MLSDERLALIRKRCENSIANTSVGKYLEEALGYADKLREENGRLRAAFTDCLQYIDVDNLTMQTKERNWRAVLKGKAWKSGNVEVDG
jgi:hypothetical protein